MKTTERLITLMMGQALCLSWIATFLIPTLMRTEAKPVDIFHGFFPCLPNENIITQEDAQSCDLFVYSAVQLAFEKYDNTLDLIEIETGGHDGNIEVLYNVYTAISNSSEEFSSNMSQFRAAIGTDHRYIEGRTLISLSEDIGIPMVSYGLADSRVDVFPNFYRTIPSTDTLNQARIKILDHFQWLRIGILGTDDQDYMFQVENFKAYFSYYVEREREAELSYVGLTSSLSSSLQNLYRFNIKIILGFFGPEESRAVLCEASSTRYNLTTPDHVWILPSYYNPDWWKEGGASNHSKQETVNCTDKKMMSILNSVIFIDPVKYPPLETPLSEFFPALLNRTRSDFQYLDSEVYLEPLLQHSRAVSAYDSTLLLAHSLSEGRVDTKRLQGEITCALCRIYPQRFVPPHLEEDFRICQSNCLNFSVKRTLLLRAYGQVLISQFINGTHCPMVLFWPSNSSTPEDLKHNFVFVSDLSNNPDLGLDSDILFLNRSAFCPQQFYWKGHASPPVTNVISHSEIPEWALILVGVLTGLAEILVMSLIIFTVIWRENSHVKPTSPRVNILILVGVSMVLPIPLISGLVTSATRYRLADIPATALCQLQLWISIFGYSILINGALVKIYRLYRIFHNKSLKMKLAHLKDRDLILTTLVLTLPTLVILCIWTAVSRLMFKADTMDNGKEEFQFVRLTSCASQYSSAEVVCRVLLLVYLLLVALVAVLMSLLITRASHAIKLDLNATRVTLYFSAFIATIAFILEEVMRSPFQFKVIWGLRFIHFFVAPTMMACGFFLYQVFLVARDSEKKVKHKICEIKLYLCECSDTQQNMEQYYRNLLCQIEELSQELAQKEEAIRKLRTEMGLQLRQDNPLNS